MRTLGDLLNAFQKKKKEKKRKKEIKEKKRKKAQWFLHLNKTFIGFITDLQASDKSVVAIF